MCYGGYFAGLTACKRGLVREIAADMIKYVRKTKDQKMMITKIESIQNVSLRKMEYPFGWIPQRFITGGVMKALSVEEILLYVFLSLVSDKRGISWYGGKRISELTGMTVADIITARYGLEQKGFIAYTKPYYQVLQMPAVKAAAGKGE